MKTEMWRRRKNSVLPERYWVLLLVVAAPLCATTASIELSLEQVLSSSQRFFPKIAIEAQKKRKAEAKFLATQGAFDLRLSGKGQVEPTGFYQNEEVITHLEQNTTLWGTRFYGGWRFSDGTFPSYEGKRVTGSSGEVELGLEIPLLQGGSTDLARTTINQAKASVEESQANVGVSVNRTLLVASEKYWKWVAAVRKLEIAKEVLTASIERQEWIEQRTRLGDLPAFEAIDNKRTIIDREAKVVEAERSLRQATLELSFYYRDQHGTPVLAPTERAPKLFPDPKLISEDELDKRLSLAVKLRPELAQIVARVKKIDASERLAENNLWPKLNLYGEASQDLGSVDETRRQGEIRAGLRLSIPLQRRKARGALASARADRLRVDSEKQMLLEQVRIDVATAIANLQATYRQIELARNEVEINKKLVNGERTRFKNGDSHIMFVNMRELMLGDSRLELVNAQARHQSALIGLLTVTGELMQRSAVKE